MVRVLVAEDALVTREYLVYLLEQDPEIAVVGTAWNGVEAVGQAERLRPDVILMDVFMPRLDGYEATRQIMARVPTPIVLMSASFDNAGIATTFEALKAGAMAVVAKPVGLDHPDHAESAQQVVKTVKLMAGVKVVRRWLRGAYPDSPTSPVARHPNVSIPIKSSRKIRLAAIGASTGGPPVLREILEDLPPDFPAPILIVQHMARGFVNGLVEWLQGSSRLIVKLAQSGEQTLPGIAYLAPDDYQMSITKQGRIRLTGEPVENGFRPSISHLFRSVAEAYGPRALGALLTGMGEDGVAGLLSLRKAGGSTIVQNEESSVVFGMPGKAIRVGAAQQVLSPREIARAIRSLVMPCEAV